MEEGKFEILPEEVMHHIQSFISSRKAAQTCLISKSWYTAWCTRPILSFDERDFRSTGGFANFTRKTIQRYRESNLNVPTFRLRFNEIPEFRPITSYLSALTNRKINEYTYLANELILDALKLGVNDLKFEIDEWILSSYVLPVQVFAATTNLRKLVVSGCVIAIDHWPMINNTLGGVTSSCLTSLSLLNVSIGEDTITNILLGCPLIEDFNVHECKGLSKINVSMMQYNLKKFRVERLFCTCTLSLSIEIEEPILGPVSNGQISVPKYRNLSSLTLKYVTMDNKFFHNFSHKFPCLENLTIYRCSGFKDVEIGGPSLKCISFIHASWELDNAEFDVPSIQKFEFSVVNPPSMSFTTSSREWESYISLSDDVEDVSWFNKLRKFLAELSQSRISLNVNISVRNEFAYVQYYQDFRIGVVENLMLGVKPESTMCSALINNLLCSCHPKFITLSGDNNLEERNKKILGLLIRSEFKQTNPDYLNPAENLLCNLKKVNVEFFDRTLMQWQSFPPWELFFVYSKIAKGREKIRFRLRWGHFSN